MVLLAYEAHVQLHGAPDCSIGELLGDGSDPARENSLEPGVLLRAVELPPPVPGQRWAYRRATGRQRAEWPLVEAMVLLELDGATILQARVVAGAVAPVPLRLPWVEEQLTGRKASQANLEAAAARASEGAAPLPGNRYKLELLVGTVLDCLEQAAGGA